MYEVTHTKTEHVPLWLRGVLYSAANDPEPKMIPDVEPQMILPENKEWHGFWFPGFSQCLSFSFIYVHQFIN